MLCLCGGEGASGWGVWWGGWRLQHQPARFQDSGWDVLQSAQALRTVVRAVLSEAWWFIPPPRSPRWLPEKIETSWSPGPPTQIQEDRHPAREAAAEQCGGCSQVEIRPWALSPNPLQTAQLPRPNPDPDNWSSAFSSRAQIDPTSSNAVIIVKPMLWKLNSWYLFFTHLIWPFSLWPFFLGGGWNGCLHFPLTTMTKT